jgi:hypothetical protein
LNIINAAFLSDGFSKKEANEMKFFLRFGLTALTEQVTRVALATVMLLTFQLMSVQTIAAQAISFCTDSSENMLTSCADGAESDYWLAIAQCNNFPNAGIRNSCKAEAANGLESRIEECQAQFEVRLEICEVLGEKVYNPVIRPADFADVIDNPFFPLKPGTTFIYEGTTEAGFEHTEVRVTHRTREILGITCVEVRDTVTVDGELVESTFDWYAQDKDGNVWYFGENSREFEDGLVVSLAGSWMGGVDRAKPGIIMKAHPHVGNLYRQEFSLGVAEDMAKVLSLNESVTVPYGSFTDCLKTREFTALEPDLKESKFYAPGIGNIRTVDLATGERVDLIDIITE